MSYESLKLAQNPALYWRLDMVGVAADGDTIPDISPNGLDGEARIAGNLPPYGLASPIESDPASKAMLIQNHPTAPSSASFVERVTNPLIEATGDFTLEGWFAVSIGSVANSASLFYKRNALGDGFCYGMGVSTARQFAGNMRDSANNSWNVTSTTIFELDAWYYVVLVRLGNALSLYVNGRLEATTLITSGLPTLNESGKLQLAGLISGDYQYRADEVAVTLAATGGAVILAQYEAAFNDLQIFGEANIHTSAVLSGSAEPDPIAYPFRHNWSEPVIERLSWRSSVFKPVNGSTQLRSQRSAPRRQIEYQHLAYNEQLRRRIEARAYGGRTSLVQFEPDKVAVDALSAGATSATANFQYMDFEEGQRVLVYQDDDLFEYQTLTLVSDSLIEWEDGLSRDYVRPWLKPVRVGRLPLSQSLELQTDTIADGSVQYDLLEEDEPLAPRRITPFTPTVTYRSRECWDLREWQGHNWDELPKLEFTSDRTLLDPATGVVSTKTYRWGADMLQPWNGWYKGRAAIAKYLGWLYERAGQSNPFWMPTFRQDLLPVSVSGNVLVVSGHEYTDLYSPGDTRRDLAFVYNDGTVSLRHIESSVVDGSNDSLELDSAVPTLTNLRWLSFLRRVVLSSDDVELAWETDDVLRVAFAVVDAPLDLLVGSPSPSPSPSASGSATASPSHSSSPSQSPSASRSPSVSGSPSVSPSHSQSPSSSTSASPSPSVSPSASGSPSHSASPSFSPSHSASPST